MSRFPHLVRDYYNLRYACHVCNMTKSDYWPSPEAEAAGIGVVDLTVGTFADHYQLAENGIIQPVTASAQVTISLLRLNPEHLTQLRAFIFRNNWTMDTSPIPTT